MKYAYLSLLAVFALTSFSSARAQAVSVPFQPGEWQINSVVTTSTGKSVHRNSDVCAKSATDAWQPQSPNQECSAPALTAIADGYNVELKCRGDAGPVKWKSISSIHETFSSGGSVLVASGTTTTTVSYAGHAPITESATLHSTGKRTGACK